MAFVRKLSLLSLSFLIGCSSPQASQQGELPKQATPRPRLKNVTEIVIDGPAEDQRAVDSFLNAVLDQVSENPSQAPSPFGKSDQFYNGHVFWDADWWVFPALVFVSPNRAKSISTFRVETMKEAAWKSAAWEVSQSGQDVTPPQSRKNKTGIGTYAFALGQASILGLIDEASANEKIKLTLNTYRDLFFRNGEWAVSEVKSIDEYAESVDQDLITSLLVRWCLGNGTFSADGPVLPRLKDGSLLTYSGDTRQSYQQTTALLALWPLQYPEAESQSETMIEMYADKVSKHGPAMSDAIHALLLARLGHKDRAYKTWAKSWKEFTNDTLNFREYRKGPERTYFLTGAAGCLNSVIYGFLGFRIDSKVQAESAWNMELKPLNGQRQFLSVKPNLPSQWQKVEFRNFSVLDRRFNLVATHEGVVVTEGD